MKLSLEVQTFPKANSGVYFHTEWQESGWPAKGYEIQVNNSHSDPKRTAGVYGIKDNLDAVAKDGVWFTLTIRVEGRHIVSKVDDKVIEDYTQEEKPAYPIPESIYGRSTGVVGLRLFKNPKFDPSGGAGSTEWCTRSRSRPKTRWAASSSPPRGTALPRPFGSRRSA